MVLVVISWPFEAFCLRFWLGWKAVVVSASVAILCLGFGRDRAQACMAWCYISGGVGVRRREAVAESFKRFLANFRGLTLPSDWNRGESTSQVVFSLDILKLYDFSSIEAVMIWSLSGGAKIEIGPQKLNIERSAHELTQSSHRHQLEKWIYLEQTLPFWYNFVANRKVYQLT